MFSRSFLVPVRAELAGGGYSGGVDTNGGSRDGADGTDGSADDGGSALRSVVVLGVVGVAVEVSRERWRRPGWRPGAVAVSQWRW